MRNLRGWPGRPGLAGPASFSRGSKTPPGQPAQPATVTMAGSHRDCQRHLARSSRPSRQSRREPPPRWPRQDFGRPSRREPPPARWARRVPSQCRHRPGMTGTRRRARAAGPRAAPFGTTGRGGRADWDSGGRAGGSPRRPAHNLKRRQGKEAAPKGPQADSEGSGRQGSETAEGHCLPGRSSHRDRASGEAHVVDSEAP